LSEPSQPKTLRDVWRVVFRRRWLFLLATCLAMLTVLVLSQFLQLKYTGTASFERRTPRTTAEGGVGVGQSSIDTYRNTLWQEIMGKRAIEKTIIKLGLDTNLPRNQGQLTDKGKRRKQDLIRSMQKNAHFNYEVRTAEIDIVTVSFTSDDPRLAKEVPDTLIEEYILRVKGRVLKSLTDSSDYAEKQLERARRELASPDPEDKSARKNRLDYEVKFAGRLFDNPNALGDRIIQLTNEIDGLDCQVQAARKKKARLEELIKQANPEVDGPGTKPTRKEWGPNPMWGRLQEELRRAEEQLSIARTVNGMKENHPTVQSLKLNIKRIKTQIEKTDKTIVVREVEVLGGINVRRVELAKVMSDLEASEDAAAKKNRDLESLHKLLTESGPVRQEYARLLKEEEQKQDEADRWVKRQSEIKENLAAEILSRRTQLEQMDRAEEQYRPSWPVWWQLLVISIGVGLACGAGLVFLFDLLDRSITTTDEAMTEFDVPLYGVVGEILMPGDRFWTNLKRYVLVPLVSLVIIVALGLAVGDLVLKLQWPEQHGLWQTDPFGYMKDHILAVINQAGEGG
jgi:uncharacterized protein involved in exopolysaccharide biosynthesis